MKSLACREARDELLDRLLIYGEGTAETSDKQCVCSMQRVAWAGMPSELGLCTSREIEREREGERESFAAVKDVGYRAMRREK